MKTSPDFAVRREVIQTFFTPPIAKSTFYDLVQRGKIAEVHGLRGYYRLNESLNRLGMPPVDQPPRLDVASGAVGNRVLVDIALALSMPDEFPVPSESLSHSLTEAETKTVLDLYEKYSLELREITAPAQRLAFAQGVIDAAAMTS